ncbi:MAG: alpha/beta fold hydrolase [Gemmatimonadetes bacterium]|nr:alpha/beta fold hydrolase [Gemmatimonadota bacterium]
MERLLHHERVTAPGESPGKWLYVLHGIYGAGRNWASVVRRVVRERPEWGGVLVDVRQHGASQGFSPPHTVAAAAADLQRLGDAIGEPAGLLGHSFGGKVALAYTRAAAFAGAVWIIDSTPAPGERRGSAWRMLEVLRSLPDRFESRDAAVRALQQQGIELPVAQWMATNLARAHGGYGWRFRLDAMQELLEDFARADLWDVVEAPPAGAQIHFVRAAESDVLTAAATEKIREAGRRNGRAHLHTLAGGHWLNADNPEGIVSLLTEHLPA